MLADSASAITALLGPTNTGKTHQAVERMLEHPTGMIGLPLRLLAREVYDRVSRQLGERQVALVTGEEKRVPPRPRYWVCTVESMPVDRDVDFLAVDEIQLVAHHQRGHVFTDRLLNARGRRETWFMGSHMATSLLQQLVPTAEHRRLPRLSRLSAIGATGLGGLPPRTAVIAFSASEVYELADRIRRRRGGAAVVMGALSPRTRNSQVAMYQAGEVDFIVATDAVGMGLNMDVNHVAFAALRKFDGRRYRSLTSDEVAQIAGRAGRHERNGTFGALAPLAFPPEVSHAVEQHAFSPLRHAVWRNSDLDMSSVAALTESLRVGPRRRCLVRVIAPDDATVLALLADKPEVRERASSSASVELLWQVCQIPDFRKLMAEHHAALLYEVFVQLADHGTLDAAWMEQKIRRFENADGDIETLMMRMEFIRTWSYITHKSGWVDNAGEWQMRTQAAEDTLSQALHLKLIERFVERRSRSSKHAAKRSRKGGRARHEAPAPSPSHPFAALGKLRVADVPQPDEDDWVDRVVTAPHEAFHCDAKAVIRFTDDVELASLVRGQELLLPDVKLSRDFLAGAQARLLGRLISFARDMVHELLLPLRDLHEQLTGNARGLVYQLEHGLGNVPCRVVREQLAAVGKDERRKLAAAGMIVGHHHVLFEPMFRPEALKHRAAICHAHTRRLFAPSEPIARRRAGVDDAAYRAAGYQRFSERVVRIDVVEKLSRELQTLSQPFLLPTDLITRFGSSEDELESIVIALGYPRSRDGFVRKRRRRRGRG